MFFRTESLSAGAAGASAASIVNAAAKVIGAAFAAVWGRRGPRLAETLTLSNHDLRDIGVDHHVAGQPVPYDLLDLCRAASPSVITIDAGCELPHTNDGDQDHEPAFPPPAAD